MFKFARMKASISSSLRAATPRLSSIGEIGSNAEVEIIVRRNLKASRISVISVGWERYRGSMMGGANALVVLM